MEATDLQLMEGHSAALAAEWPSDQRLRFYLPAKRVLDFTASLVLPILLFPLLVLVALAIKVCSPGPVFHRWEVVGAKGRPFTGYKFRTMVLGADGLKHKLLGLNEMRGPVFKIANDPCIAHPGRWLRKYSIDQLPQLWSVLKGDMSLVGPRPPLRSEYAQYNDWHRQRLALKPGLTGPMQVHRRGHLSLAERVYLEIDYIEHYAVWRDVAILLRSIPAVISGRGAY